MRRILVDHARRRGTLRRGGDMQRVELIDAFDNPPSDGLASGEIEAVDEALTRLEETGRHERKCQVVKLRFFAGLTNEQTAELIGVSVSSVKRDWEFAKAWLTREILRPEQSPRSGNGHGRSR
jgi:RNA polymerase sigma factor (TIGR02999 family)